MGQRTAAVSPVLLKRLAGQALPAGATYTRSTIATYSDVGTVVQTAGINTLRGAPGTVAYVGGVAVDLLEGGRTNSVLYSRDLTNAAWTFTGTGSRTQNATGLDGTANSATTLTDSDATAFAADYQTVTVPVDSNTHTIAFWIKKDTDQTRFPGLDVTISGGTLVQRLVQLNTQTGALFVVTATGTGTTRVVDGGLWWIVETTVANNGSALNTMLLARIYPAVTAAFGGGNNPAATGSCVVGQVQVELASSFYSSPIFTTSSAVSRGADALSLPGVTCGTATLFYRYYDLATATWVDTVSAYTSGTTITPPLNRAYQVDAVLNGTLTAPQAAAILGVP